MPNFIIYFKDDLKDLTTYLLLYLQILQMLFTTVSTDFTSNNDVTSNVQRGFTDRILWTGTRLTNYSKLTDEFGNEFSLRDFQQKIGIKQFVHGIRTGLTCSFVIARLRPVLSLPGKCLPKRFRCQTLYREWQRYWINRRISKSTQIDFWPVLFESAGNLKLIHKNTDPPT